MPPRWSLGSNTENAPNAQEGLPRILTRKDLKEELQDFKHELGALFRAELQTLASDHRPDHRPVIGKTFSQESHSHEFTRRHQRGFLAGQVKKINSEKPFAEASSVQSNRRGSSHSPHPWRRFSRRFSAAHSHNGVRGAVQSSNLGNQWAFKISEKGADVLPGDLVSTQTTITSSAPSMGLASQTLETSRTLSQKQSVDPEMSAPIVSANKPRRRGKPRTQTNFASLLSRIETKRATGDGNISCSNTANQSMLFEEEDSLCSKFANCIRSEAFDGLSVVFVILNAAFIGWSTNYTATNLVPEVPPFFRSLEIAFCIIFTVELCLRIFVYGRGFFIVLDWKWNVFDSLVVFLQLLEETFTLMNQGSSVNLSSIRILRVIRLVRVLRLIRVVRFITELRTLVSSLFGSMKFVFWTFFLLFMLTYICAVFLTQVVTDHRLSLQSNDSEELIKYYGSLTKTIFMLYQAQSGGIDWNTSVDPLVNEIHWIMGLVFALFITLSVIALMNVVTGVFVDSALLIAKRDKDTYMVNSVRSLFDKTDNDNNGTISWEEFCCKLDTHEMMEYFKNIDVDISEAHGIFSLLDIDKSGIIESEEFLSGCMRLRGPAKALDLTVLMLEVKEMSRAVEGIVEVLNSKTRV